MSIREAGKASDQAHNLEKVSSILTPVIIDAGVAKWLMHLSYEQQYTGSTPVARTFVTNSVLSHVDSKN